MPPLDAALRKRTAVKMGPLRAYHHLADLTVIEVGAQLEEHAI